MATIQASEIFERATIILHDNTSVRWTPEEMLNWVNEGQREIVLLKPDSYSQTDSVQLAAGTKQALPSSGTLLLDVIRNMGVNGSTPGNVVRFLQRRVLDDQKPGWHAETPTAIAQHYMYEPEANPLVYYVYPPATGTAYLEIVYAKAPEELDDEDDVITLPDIYSPALLNYILYRAYSKDADYAVNAARAQEARREFLQLLGRMDLVEASLNPAFREMEKVQRTMQHQAPSHPSTAGRG